MFAYGESHEHYAVGRDAMDKLDYQTAIREFEDSVSISPHFKTLELLGECKLKIGKPSEALIPLAASIGLATNGYRAMYLIATAYLDLGETREAKKFAERALNAKSDYRAARELRDKLAGLSE